MLINISRTMVFRSINSWSKLMTGDIQRYFIIIKICVHFPPKITHKLPDYTQKLDFLSIE